MWPSGMRFPGCGECMSSLSLYNLQRCDRGPVDRRFSPRRTVRATAQRQPVRTPSVTIQHDGISIQCPAWWGAAGHPLPAPLRHIFGDCDPLFGGNSGLHLYNWQSGLWVDVCKDAPSDCAVVFTGELMARLTGNLLLPAMHEVSGIGPGPRISTPFQFCAAAAARIDPLQLKAVREGVADGSIMDNRVFAPCLAGDFVEAVSASRLSSSFLSV